MKEANIILNSKSMTNWQRRDVKVAFVQSIELDNEILLIIILEIQFKSQVIIKSVMCMDFKKTKDKILVDIETIDTQKDPAGMDP